MVVLPLKNEDLGRLSAFIRPFVDRFLISLLFYSMLHISPLLRQFLTPCFALSFILTHFALK